MFFFFFLFAYWKWYAINQDTLETTALSKNCNCNKVSVHGVWCGTTNKMKKLFDFRSLHVQNEMRLRLNVVCDDEWSQLTLIHCPQCLHILCVTSSFGLCFFFLLYWTATKEKQIGSSFNWKFHKHETNVWFSKGKKKEIEEKIKTLRWS